MAKTPETLGYYSTLEKIGEGAMGDIFLCEDPYLARKIVVKRMKRKLHPDPTGEKRFYEEVRLLAGLKHPGIPQIYGFWAEKKQLHIAMEYLDGLNIGDLISGCAPIPPVIVTAILDQILDALVHAHRLGVVHRDIKPSNLILTSQGQIKILDFGIAKTEGVDLGLTQEGTLIGTGAYMSPEQAEGADLNSKSDIFSLGIVLVELLSGKNPFRGKTREETMLRIMQGSFDMPANTPGWLAKGLRKMLSTKISDRPDAFSLRRWLDQSIRNWPRDLQPILSRAALKALQHKEAPDEKNTAPASAEEKPATLVFEPAEWPLPSSASLLSGFFLLLSGLLTGLLLGYFFL